MRYSQKCSLPNLSFIARMAFRRLTYRSSIAAGVGDDRRVITYARGVQPRHFAKTEPDHLRNALAHFFPPVNNSQGEPSLRHYNQQIQMMTMILVL